ncbi:MAG TPA: type II toxin-antitoxin system RelE/ParE family toxin [Rhodopila sp.]|jgi:putative addiction module killer protein|nr:type II toxin-antitoxin system RelE/ParE family toxin [Rhodopila sp.]
MFEVRQSAIFRSWFIQLPDPVIRARIDARLSRLTLGLFGDAKSVGEGIVELRLHFGPGYRIYFTQRDGRIILLLCGGDKATQRRDIARAKLMARNLED